MGDGGRAFETATLPAAFRTAISIRRDQSEVCHNIYRGLLFIHPSMLSKEQRPRTDNWSDTVR